jgi:beta-mannosidase
VAERVDGGAVVRVTASTLVRELCLFPDRLAPDASVDRMLVTLLPEETAELRVSSRGPLDLDALCRPPVLRAANDGIRAGRAPRG